jgi:hypothetical protein
MKGHIAQRYGDLVKDMWSGTTKTTAPLKLRVCAQNVPIVIRRVNAPFFLAYLTSEKT